MIQPQTLIVGIGSPYGDDQAGWRVIERLAEEIGDIHDSVQVRLARTPGDLLNWGEGVQRLLVCDACQGDKPVGTIESWSWPADELAEIQWAGTHDLGLCTVLKLLEQLGRLPADVKIWGIYAEEAKVNAPISVAVESAIERLVNQIKKTLDFDTLVHNEAKNA